MNWKMFFMPNMRSLVYFPAFFFIMAFVLWSSNASIIPCMSAPFVSGELQWSADLCSLNPFSLLLIKWTFISYFVVMMLLVGVPYIISCVINYFTPKKKVLRKRKKAVKKSSKR